MVRDRSLGEGMSQRLIIGPLRMALISIPWGRYICRSPLLSHIANTRCDAMKFETMIINKKIEYQNIQCIKKYNKKIKYIKIH